MIHIHCHGQHGTSGDLCSDCEELREYANQRLHKCPFQAKKPICAHCTVHCYKPAIREKIKRVMRYAGPRMLYKHPVLTVFHLLNNLEKQRK